MLLLTGQRTCDSQVAGSSLGRAALRSGLGQATYTCVPLSPSSIIWYQPRGMMMMMMMMMMKLPILPCTEKLESYEITPTKTVKTENGPISRGTHLFDLFGWESNRGFGGK